MDYGIDRVHWALEGGYRTPGGGRITDPVEQWMYDRSRQPFYIVDVADALLDLEWERSLLEDPWPDVLRVHEVIDSRSGSGALFNVEYRFESTRFDTNRRGVLAMISLLRAAAGGGAFVETDPFCDGTARIQRRQQDERMVLWSVGPNGIDEGGEVPLGEIGFLPRSSHPWFIVRFGRDITLALPRRPDASSGRR
jgi:hypothetical protein